MWHGRTLAVVLPTYNEAGSIAECIRGFESLGIVDDLVVVNNNAHPDTSPAVAGTSAREVHEAVQGYGAAIQRGLRETSSADLVCICEPDGTFDPADLLKLLPFTVDVDVVFGSRTVQTFILHGANMGAFLRWGNWAVAKLAMVLFNSVHLSDVGCTFRVLSRDAIDQLQPEFRRDDSAFGFEMMLHVLSRGVLFIQVPVKYQPRIGDSSVTGDRMMAFRLGVAMILLAPPHAVAGEMSATERETVRRLLVDARPISHPTAGGRGVGNHVAGLLEGLAEGETPVTALVGNDRERDVLDPTVSARIDVEVLGRSAIRRRGRSGDVVPGHVAVPPSDLARPDPGVGDRGRTADRSLALRRDPLPVPGAVPHRGRPAPSGSSTGRAQPNRRRVLYQLRVRQSYRRRSSRPRPRPTSRDRLRRRGPVPTWRPRCGAIAGPAVLRRRPSVDRRRDHRRRRPQEHRRALVRVGSPACPRHGCPARWS